MPTTIPDMIWHECEAKASKKQNTKSVSLMMVCLSNVAHFFTERKKAIPRTVLNYKEYVCIYVVNMFIAIYHRLHYLCV